MNNTLDFSWRSRSTIATDWAITFSARFIMLSASFGMCFPGTFGDRLHLQDRRFRTIPAHFLQRSRQSLRPIRVRDSFARGRFTHLDDNWYRARAYQWSSRARAKMDRPAGHLGDHAKRPHNSVYIIAWILSRAETHAIKSRQNSLRNPTSEMCLVIADYCAHYAAPLYLY